MESFSFLDDMEDEKKRLLADRRKTNLAITPRVVALPKILKIFFMKFKVRVPCTTSDLFSGYWQVCLSKESRDMTTFTAPSDTVLGVIKLLEIKLLI